jgi:DNA-directed RNA polymerase specialized sigma24 family protein
MPDSKKPSSTRDEDPSVSLEETASGSRDASSNVMGASSSAEAVSFGLEAASSSAEAVSFGFEVASASFESGPMSGNDRPVKPETRPVSLVGSSASHEDAATSPVDASKGLEGGSASVTREVFTAFLGKKSTQDRILQVVRHRLKKWKSREDAEDVAQKVNMHLLGVKTLPSSPERMRAWVSAVTANFVIDLLRASGPGEDAATRAVSAEDLPPDEAEATDALDSPGLGADDAAFAVKDEAFALGALAEWLTRVVSSKADRLTLEMVASKAKTSASNADLAAEFGMTEAAFDNRLLRFKAKWLPAWQREKARRRRAASLLFVILMLLALAALAWLASRWPRPKPTSPTLEEPPALPVPAPTTSAVPSFDQAFPTKPPSKDDKAPPPDEKGRR